MAVKELHKGGLDPSTALGMGIGFGGLIFGFLLEGGNVFSLIGISALIIIVAGTVGALVTSSSLVEVLSIPKLVKDSMVSSPGPQRDLALLIISFGEKARREGLLSLEEDIVALGDEFMAKGIKMIVDGTDPEVVKSIMENDIYLYELKRKEEAALFETAGGFSPTMGIIGTVMGLVLVLSGLGGNPEQLGHSIATAFIATLYGIGFANLFWLPIANKLKSKMNKEILVKELMLLGVLSIQAGENPSIIKEKLNAYFDDELVEEEK